MLVLQCSLTVLTLRTWKTRLVTPFPLAEGLRSSSSPLPVRRRGDPDDARKQGAAERGEPIGNEEGVSGPALRAASFCSWLGRDWTVDEENCGKHRKRRSLIGPMSPGWHFVFSIRFHLVTDGPSAQGGRRHYDGTFGWFFLTCLNARIVQGRNVSFV